jgi:glycosyltransferase involved in cell wall biosynthesis
MKIGFDAKRLFNNNTGLGNYSRSLVRNLQQTQPKNDYHLFSPEAQQTSNTAYFFNTERFHIHQSKARLKAYWRSFSIVKDLQKTGIELYHGLSNELPHNLQQSGIKSVVTIHDLIFKIYPETYSLSERLIYDRKFRYACEHADKIVAISENTKRDITRLYDIPESKISVIYQSCNPIFYQMRLAGENESVKKQYQLPEQYFLYVGSIEARKNLKLIIEAYRLKKGQINIPLVVIGKGGAYKNECKKLIAAYQLEESFIWHENLADNLHLQSVYQMASALIYPSLYEGFGLPIAEALLSKTPVIAADTSSLWEAGGTDSIYINPRSAAALSDAMLRVISDREFVENMKEKGFLYAHQSFDRNQLTSQMLALYQSMF